MTWFLEGNLLRNTTRPRAHLSWWNCFGNLIVSVTTRFSASAPQIFLQPVSVERLNRQMLSTHHRCPYSTYSSAWGASSRSVVKRKDVPICITRVWGWGECLSMKPVMEFTEMQKDTFPASSSQRGTSFKKGTAKLKVNFVLRLHLHLTSLNYKQNLSGKAYETPWYSDSLPFRLRFSSKTMNHPIKKKTKKHKYTKILHPRNFRASPDIPVVDILSHHHHQQSEGARSTQELCGHRARSERGGLHLPHRLKASAFKLCF